MHVCMGGVCTGVSVLCFVDAVFLQRWWWWHVPCTSKVTCTRVYNDCDCGQVPLRVTSWPSLASLTSSDSCGRWVHSSLSPHCDNLCI